MRAKAHQSHSIPEDLCGDKCGIKPFGKCFLHVLLGDNVGSSATCGNHHKINHGLPFEECGLEG